MAEANTQTDPSRLRSGDACPVPDFGRELYKMRRIHRLTPELMDWLRGCFGGGGAVTGDYMPLPPPTLDGSLLVALNGQWVELIPAKPEWAGKILAIKDGEWVEIELVAPPSAALAGKTLVMKDGRWVEIAPGAEAGKPQVLVDGRFEALSDHTVVTSLARYVHTQDVPAREWNIYHGLGTQYPRLFILNQQKRELIGGADWATATANYLRLSFMQAVGGMAILTGE